MNEWLSYKVILQFVSALLFHFFADVFSINNC